MLRWTVTGATADDNRVAVLPPTLIPPFRFSVVEGSNRQECVYRSAFPTSKNLRFLKRLKLKTMISLMPKNCQGEHELRQFCAQQQIQHEIFPVSGTQEPLAKDENDLNAPAPTHALCANVLTLCIDPDRLPVLIHCTNGAHVTGLIVALLRRLQKFKPDYYLDEFARFTKNHCVDEDEESFIARFFQEVTLPRRLPLWLWAGERLSRHPTLPLFGAAVSVGISNEDYWSQSSTTTSSSALDVSSSSYRRGGGKGQDGGDAGGGEDGGMMMDALLRMMGGGGGSGANTPSPPAPTPTAAPYASSSSSSANAATVKKPSTSSSSAPANAASSAASSSAASASTSSSATGGSDNASSSSSSSSATASATATTNAAAATAKLSAAVKSMVNDDDADEDEDGDGGGPRGLTLEHPGALFRRRPPKQ